MTEVTAEIDAIIARARTAQQAYESTGNQERFSLIFFCTQGAVSDKFDEVERQQVQSMGFVLPPAGTSAHVYQPAKVEKRFEIGQKQFRQFQAKRTHDEEGVAPRPVKVAKRALEAGQEKVTLSAFGVGLSEPTSRGLEHWPQIKEPLKVLRHVQLDTFCLPYPLNMYSLHLPTCSLMQMSISSSHGISPLCLTKPATSDLAHQHLTCWF